MSIAAGGDAVFSVIPNGDHWAGILILGLPLMNGYFTIFDGEADHGRGEVRFAKRKG